MIIKQNYYNSQRCHICFNHQNIVNGKIIGPSCQNNYDPLQKQLGFHPSKDPFTILDEKSVVSHVPIKLFYASHIFVWLCNLSLVGPIFDPSMFVTCMEHNGTYEKWILGHVHHVQMTHQFVYGPYDKLWFQPHQVVYRCLINNDVRHPWLIDWGWLSFRDNLLIHNRIDT